MIVFTVLLQREVIVLSLTALSGNFIKFIFQARIYKTKSVNTACEMEKVVKEDRVQLFNYCKDRCQCHLTRLLLWAFLL